MYYEEQIINGVLCWRATPTGEWTEVTKESLSKRVVKAESDLQRLRNILQILNDFLSE